MKEINFQFYPRSWAPNVLTLLGWGFVMGCFVFEGVLDYDISANSPGKFRMFPFAHENNFPHIIITETKLLIVSRTNKFLDVLS